MKALLLNITLFAFTFNQAMAYTPSQEDIEISKSLDEISKELDTKELTDIKSSLSKVSKKKFERVKKRALKKLNKQLDEAQDLSQQEQEVLIEKMVTKQFKKARKVSQKIQKRKRLARKLARKAKITPEALAQKMNESTSKRAELAFKEELKNDISKAGGYDRYLERKIASIEELNWNELKQAKSNHKRLSFKKNNGGDNWGGLDFALIVLTTIVIFLAVFIIGLLVILFTGGTVLGALAVAGYTAGGLFTWMVVVNSI